MSVGKRTKPHRVTAAEREAFFAELEATARAQKREHDATRRRRLRDFGKLYVPLQVSNPSICYYCKDNPAETQDHCPSLLALDSFGADYFQEQRVSILLVPSCMSCNNEYSGRIVFCGGRMRPFSWQDARKWAKKRAEAATARRKSKRARRR